MNKKYDLNLLSQERKWLFGIAILWIMLFHTTLNIPSDWSILVYLKRHGNMGVDIFLFLSGIGLYYSYSKDRDLWLFYKKRLLRVVLPFALIAVVWFALFQPESIPQFLLDITLLSFWLQGNSDQWFIASIVLFYLVYPFLYEIIEKYGWMAIAGLVCIIISLNTFLYLQSPTVYYSIEICLTRIPVFLIGCGIAAAVNEHKQLPKRTALYCLLCIIMLFWLLVKYPSGFANYYGFIRYMYCLISISICVVLSTIVQYLKSLENSQVILWFGDYTLEIYLTHEKAIIAINPLFINGQNSWDKHRILLNTAAIACSLVCSVFLKRICEFIVNQSNLPSHSTVPQEDPENIKAAG